MKTAQILTGAAFGLMFLPSTAAASTLYGTSYIPGSVSSLYTINTSTGALTLVHSTGLDDLGDLTSDQVSTIWAIQLTTDDLATINPMTGAGTLGPTITGTGLSATAPIASIAWDPVTGVLYGNSSTGYGATADTLYSINPTTGVATLIGRLGFSDVYALGFGQNGTLYGIEDADEQGGLININLTTGAGTLVGDTGLAGPFDIASDPAGSGYYVADGNTYALYKVNVSTGGVTEVGSYEADQNIAGLAFIGSAATSSPEPGSVVLLALGVGLVAIGAGLRGVSRVAGPPQRSARFPPQR